MGGDISLRVSVETMLALGKRLQLTRDPELHCRLFSFLLFLAGQTEFLDVWYKYLVWYISKDLDED